MATNTELTTQQITAGLQIAAAIGTAIRELGEVPEGQLFARMMGHLDLRSFDAVIDALVRAGVVRRANHMLTWIGDAEVR
jgi:hypothetical protein